MGDLTDLIERTRQAPEGTRYMGPDDDRVGPHPYMGPDDDIRACDLPGCGRRASNPIHSSAPAGSRVLESAKAVIRAYGDGRIDAGLGSGSKALALLDDALALAGHATRPPRLSERVMAEVDRLRREDPEEYARIAQVMATDLVTKPEYRKPTLTEDGTTEQLAQYQRESR